MCDSLLELIEKKFKKSKFLLAQELDEHLTDFDVTDEYKEEITNKFNADTKLIFDMGNTGTTFLDFITKVYGKSNIASYHEIEFDRSEDVNNKNEINKQLIYLSGKLDILNKSFNFKKNYLFTYGNFHNMSYDDGNYKFASFKAQNSKFFFKVKDNYAYGIFNSHGRKETLFKIKNDFFTNPVMEISDEINLEYNDETRIDNIENIINTIHTSKAYVKELKIYQVENN